MKYLHNKISKTIYILCNYSFYFCIQFTKIFFCTQNTWQSKNRHRWIIRVNHQLHSHLICTSCFPRAALSWFSFYLATASLSPPESSDCHQLLPSPQLFSVLSCYRLVLWPFPLSHATWITDLYQLGGLFPNFSLTLLITY